MIRTTNFIRPANRRVWPIIAGIWLLASGAAVFGLMVLLWANQARQNSNKLETHIEELGEGISRLKIENADLPSSDSLGKLNTEVVFFNELSGERSAPLLRVLENLETLLTENVWVSQLNYDLDTGRLDLSLQAEQETQLPPSLSRIEGSALLESVILERQVRLQQGRNALVQYDITAVVK